MQMIYCPNCQRRTGFRRALGFGTFFMVLNHFRFVAVSDSAISGPVYDLRITATRSGFYESGCLVGIEN